MDGTVRRLTAIALWFVVVIGLAGCYDVPKPVCGFQCGPNLACPEDYQCQQGRCVLEGAPANVSCPGTDAGNPGDAPLPTDTPEGPQIESRIPDDDADEVPTTTTITVRFTKPVFNVDASSFVLHAIFGPAVSGTFAYPDDRTVVFTPNEPLAEGSVYMVSLTSLITDANGVTLPFTEWNFMTVPDLTPPAVTLQTPAPNATGVKVNAPIAVQFNEGVIRVDQTTFTLRETETSILNGTVELDPKSHLATFHYVGSLRPDTTYTARLSAAITDFGGNPLPDAPVSWSFTTGPDDVPPRIVSYFPTAGDNSVHVSASVEIQFDEEVLGVDGTNVLLTGPGITPVPATVSYFPGAAFAQIDPTGNLAPSTTYQVTLTAGVTDTSGNPLADAPVSWTFTTAADLTPPQISLRTPSPGASLVGLNAAITVRFSEHVTGVSSSTITLSPGGGTVSYNADSFTATLVPAATLALGSTYTVTVHPGITDVAGNALSNPSSWNFTTTPDATPPVAMLTTPANGATGVATSTPIVVTFDETVQNVTGATFRVNAGGTGVDGNISSAMSNREWTYTPLVPLPANTTVTVSLTSDIRDAFANPLAPVTFTFTTAP